MTEEAMKPLWVTRENGTNIRDEKATVDSTCRFGRYRTTQRTADFTVKFFRRFSLDREF